jgi:hypothetical protein
VHEWRSGTSSHEMQRSPRRVTERRMDMVARSGGRWGGGMMAWLVACIARAALREEVSRCEMRARPHGWLDGAPHARPPLLRILVLCTRPRLRPRPRSRSRLARVWPAASKFIVGHVVDVVLLLLLLECTRPLPVILPPTPLLTPEATGRLLTLSLLSAAIAGSLACAAAC